MDETAVAGKSEYRKPNEVLAVDAVAYNIEDLPDSILEHILSFVPMVDAVRTCVLSKKWQYLWTSLPNLALSEWYFSNRELFPNFVERALLQRSSRIKRLVLSYEVLGDKSCVDVWVSAAVKRNVQECFLNLSVAAGNFALPYCLFTCATLTHLKLSLWWGLKLPSRIWLPNLRLLHLENITFVDEHLTEHLLSSPVLEELAIGNCSWDNLETLTIRAPKLKILTICEKESNCLRVPPYSCRVSIPGNNLESIRFASPFLNDYQVEKSSSLFEVHIDVSCRRPSRTGQIAYRLHKLLGAMCSVKKLTLSSTAVKVLCSVDELCSHLPVFPNLKLLDLGRLDMELRVIIKLLHSAPHLETLRLSNGVDVFTGDDEDGAILDPAPRCFGRHLRQIELFHALLCEEEFRLLELLLKHAMVLEKFMIWPIWHHSEQGTEKFRKKLLEILCGSKSLEITFFYSQRC